MLHGIINSIWMTPAQYVPDEDRRPLEEITAEVSAAVDIEPIHSNNFGFTLLE